MRSRLTSLSTLAVSLLLISPAFAFDTPLSPEAVRNAYFLGQHNDQSTLSFFSQYFKSLPAPDKGPYIAEVEVYTPYTQIVEASRRRSMNYSAQQAELDYRHHHDKLYIRVRIDFTDTYGLELYRSAKDDKELSGSDKPLPDFYRDFRVGLSQRSAPSHEDKWIEPLRIILQPSYVQASSHYPFIPEDLGPFSYAAASESFPFAYSSGNGFAYPTGWLVWLIYDASEVASDDATVEVITTDGQHVSVPFDLSRLR
ncbi:MAG: hypothetical protein WA789_03035 [Candidatus Acidiferrum sp.]